MKKKTKIIITSIVGIIIIIAMISYVLIGKAILRSKMDDYLKNKGYTANEITKVNVNHCLICYILPYNVWSLSVEYTDEQDILYLYNYNNKEIIFFGLGGTKAEKPTEELKHYNNR